ncbi:MULTISPECIES: DUF418 domain-containing protein [Corallococcus]|uniref:DUF418 domain-containing protein n=1 Tax=Corallococcus TaxID=83461 RepID=UPI00117D0B4D|nr:MULTISPECIES: DUF418 domain-containing protein [Corallococcus]NBD08485.1 DUF418 domain-containing protein [Corallococcus silvisoli]TSC34426.1 DUF418 domain-containing protein [Corallococcus sp. Z5C101001]
MNEASQASGSASHEAPIAPVGRTERVVLVDALRGFALCGVFISNSFAWFSGRNFLPREQARALAAPPLEAATQMAYDYLISQKFFTLFAFLFGLGFSIQLTRAEARGQPITPLYTRRLLALLAIGLVHIFGVWVGDALSVYATAGFALLLFRQRSDRTVFTWALVLLVVVPMAVAALRHYIPILMDGAEAAAEAAKAQAAQTAQLRARFLEGLSSNSFWTSQKENARFFLLAMLPRVNRLLWMVESLGRFLLGLLAGRHLLLQDVEKNRPWHRKLLGWGLLLGVLGHGAEPALQALNTAGLVDASRGLWTVVMPAVQEVGYLGLAAVYVSAFALLFVRGRGQGGMQFLAPVGRMALTNYLMQSVVSICFYDGWGLGLIGKLPPSRCVTLTLAAFALQVLFSHLWLARFRFGPAEWLWRSLTYGRLQPMRPPPTSVVVPSAP